MLHVQARYFITREAKKDAYGKTVDGAGSLHLTLSLSKCFPARRPLPLRTPGFSQPSLGLVTAWRAQCLCPGAQFLPQP